MTEALASVDVGKGGTYAMFGSMFEAVTPSAVRLIGTALRRISTAMRGEGLTPEVRLALKKLDPSIDPEALTPDMIEMIGRIAESNDPVAAIGQGLAGGLPTPVALTTGQALRDRDLLTVESQAKTGAFGAEPKDIMWAAQEAQQEALHGNVPAIQGMISPGRSPIEHGQGAIEARTYLDTLREARRQSVDAAYTAARAAGPAFISVEGINHLAQSLRKSVGDFDINNIAAVQSLLKHFEEGVATVGAGGVRGRVSGVNVHALEQWRTRASNAREQALDPTTKKAISAMISRYDKIFDAHLTDSLLKGDQRVLGVLKNARSLRARYGAMFEENDLVRKLTARSGRDRELVVADDEVVNYIFGRSKIGSRTNLTQDIQNLRRVLPEAEWNRIREEAFLRLVPTNPNSTLFPSAGYSKNLVAALKDAPEVMRTLFSREEIAMMQALRQTAINVNIPPGIAGNINPSGTAAAIGIVNRLGSKFGMSGKVLSAFVSSLASGTVGAARTAQARKAVAGVLPPRSYPMLAAGFSPRRFPVSSVISPAGVAATGAAREPGDQNIPSRLQWRPRIQ